MIKRIVVTKYRLSSPYLGEAEEFDDLLAARERALEVLRAELTQRIYLSYPDGVSAEEIANALACGLERAQETLDLFKDFASPRINA